MLARLPAVHPNIRSGQFGRDWGLVQQNGGRVWRGSMENDLDHSMDLEGQ
jgi:hypothetical protein